jgi:hypothetical protein
MSISIFRGLGSKLLCTLRVRLPASCYLYNSLRGCSIPPEPRAPREQRGSISDCVQLLAQWQRQRSAKISEGPPHLWIFPSCMYYNTVIQYCSEDALNSANVLTACTKNLPGHTDGKIPCRSKCELCQALAKDLLCIGFSTLLRAFVTL